MVLSGLSKLGGFVHLSVHSGHSLTMQLLLFWNSLDRLGWPQAHRTTRLCLPRAGIKVLHHTQLLLHVLITGSYRCLSDILLSE